MRDFLAFAFYICWATCSSAIFFFCLFSSLVSMMVAFLMRSSSSLEMIAALNISLFLPSLSRISLSSSAPRMVAVFARFELEFSLLAKFKFGD